MARVYQGRAPASEAPPPGAPATGWLVAGAGLQRLRQRPGAAVEALIVGFAYQLRDA
ncbi:MAG: hypothetical protein ACRD0D_01990 [Acidimicrobiales bacterium]